MPRSSGLLLYIVNDSYIDKTLKIIYHNYVIFNITTYLTMSNFKFIENILNGNLVGFEQSQVLFLAADLATWLADNLRVIGLQFDALTMYHVSSKYNLQGAQAFLDEYNENESNS